MREGSRTEPLFCESRFGPQKKIANRRFEAICANRSPTNIMNFKIGSFCKSIRTNRSAIRNGPSKLVCPDLSFTSCASWGFSDFGGSSRFLGGFPRFVLPVVFPLQRQGTLKSGNARTMGKIAEFQWENCHQIQSLP